MALRYNLSLTLPLFLLMVVLSAGCSDGHNASSVSKDSSDNNSRGSFAIYGVQPESASAGTALSITGTGFGSSAGNVQFGTTDAVIRSWTDSAISVIVPDVTAGRIKVTVNAGSQITTVDFIIVPSIADISSKHVQVGDTLVITGTGFGTTQGGGSINYAGTLLPVTAWSNNQIAAAIGNISHAAQGLLNVSVNNVVSNGITLTVHPAIMVVTPDTAERGDEVSVMGSLFGATQGISIITFAGSVAEVKSWSDSLIKVRVPDTAVKGDVVVTVDDIPSFGRGFTVTRVFHSINQPTGIAMDDTGMIYVANYSDGTIIQVMPGGITQTTIYKGLSHPMGLYYKAPTDLFVTCEGDGTVQRLTLGTRVTGYTYAAGFSMPAGIAFDDAGNMYVTNMGSNSISRLDLDHTLTTFATGLNKPMGIVFTGPAGGKTFKVVNNGNGTIAVIDLLGVVYPFASNLEAPKYLISDSSYNLYLTSGNTIIEVLSPSGYSITYATGLSNSYGLISDSLGYLYSSNFDNNSISKIDNTYEVYAQGLYNPWGIAFTQTGTMFIANQGSIYTGGGSISTVTADGNTQAFVQSLDDPCTGFGIITPAGITTGLNDHLFVASPGSMKASWISEVTYDGTASPFGICSQKPFFTNGNFWGISFNADVGGHLLYVTDQHNGEVITMTSSGNAYKFASGFNSPEGIAIDISGNIFVANTAGDTVSMVSAAGTFTSTYASGFRQPSGIAFDEIDTMYVSNYAGGTVSLVTTAKKILTYATGISSPTGIVIRDGVVYVASESEGKVYKLLHHADIYANGLNMPRGLAKGPDGLIYVADNTNNNIYRLDAPDKLTSYAAQVPYSTWLVFDSIGTTFLTDFVGGNLLKLSVDKVSVFASGMAGPAGVTYDPMNNIFYVSNYLNGTMSVVSGTGNLSTFVVGLSGPMGIAFSSPGNLYVANSANGTIAKVVQGSGVSVFAAGFDMPVSVALDAAKNVYTADQSRNMIFVIGKTGVVFPFAAVASPFGIAFDGNDNLFVSDTQNKQIKELILH